jgi:hypothetical protein
MTGSPRCSQEIVDAADDLGVDLPGQIHLERGIDRDQPFDPAKTEGAMGIFRAAQFQGRIAMGKPAQRGPAHQDAADRDAAIDGLAGIGDDAVLD